MPGFLACAAGAPAENPMGAVTCPWGLWLKSRQTRGRARPCSRLWGSGDGLPVLVIPLPFIYWPYWLLSFPCCLLSGEKTINVMD